MISRIQVRCALVLLALSTATHLAKAADSGDWRQVLKESIPLYGHRNWIVIADSAYPAQSRPGVQTIVSNSGQLEVLKEVLNDLSSSEHVRPIPFTDRELSYISESDAPGVTAYRAQLFALLPDAPNHTKLHEQIIHDLDQAAQTFRILIIKTNMTIPYTSVFLQLNCKYWSDADEQKLRALMAK